MNLFTIAAKSFLHRKMRTALTVLGIGVSISAFVALMGLKNNLESTLKTTYKERGTDLIVLERGTVDFTSSSIDEIWVSAIKKIPDVRDVAPILFDLYAFKFKQYFLLYGWDPGSYLMKEVKITGRAPLRDDELLLGELAARRLNKKIGDELKIKNSWLKVVGIFQSKSVFQDGALVLPLVKLQGLKKTPGKITMVNVKVRTANDLSDKEVAAKIAEIQTEIEKISPDIEVKNIQGFIESNLPLSILLGFTWGISIVAFIIVILGIVNTMTTSVLERTREIGILLAIGWERARIMALVIIESTVLGFLGGLFGIALGYVIMNSLVISPQLAGIMSVQYDATFLAWVMFVSVALGFLSGLYPAVKAVSIEPITVLRYE